MRPETVIPTELCSPYPFFYDAKVVSGFGRGSSELGIPTANIPVGKLDTLEAGIYFGWCKLARNERLEYDVAESNGKSISFNNGLRLKGKDLEVLPMVMSIGWNPFYENKKKAAEVHILHKFDDNFYGASIKLVILGYIRPELNYTTKEALIEDIHKDTDIARTALEISPYDSFRIILTDESLCTSTESSWK
ncbi:riboflavin kinase [Metschnikowia bicuspidata var. bicuspidata NRRL YB-4993]|uniref:Riboflavin kinase n=1 Tax=Metschnikowia bicuspidata var. bicuspidata NRRL YB-4993 TaxID=869754 RepID=A0A1A0HFJ3_9ASCO|nr:riboflavin kinase [Metschnikowia bicuspidata var. bicuspidata NRRL YB-4993]OBA22919.1 riboflavin kinase [Metschnikowia bicuspidata var. bicuspidata NRRL YB-4993]